ncbi:hypothetical protein MTBBW1_1860027 [Desulfamplus magnetovallimortis]|uniref:Uncharacterized protein n=1 Tax=Desulfamplus magnetovallimortis TaxID=1246637 RepID=A0A1W1HAN3_9BACT|nr:hypothetical protein MTBBW1_1860027 [Desulfamplus magnetovallimortis]
MVPLWVPMMMPERMIVAAVGFTSPGAPAGVAHEDYTVGCDTDMCKYGLQESSLSGIYSKPTPMIF